MPNNIGEKIRIARVTADWTQEFFAEKLGISRVYLGQIEKGEKFPSSKIMIKIAKYVDGLDEYLFLIKNSPLTDLQKQIEELPKPFSGDTEDERYAALKHRCELGDQATKEFFLEEITVALRRLSLAELIKFYIEIRKSKIVT